MYKKILLLIIALFIIIGIYSALFNRVPSNDKKVEVRDFESCISTGNSVIESYPRRCIYEGSEFIEDIGNVLDKADFIRLDSPHPNDKVKSPLLIKGEARGQWFFEASFPVEIRNVQGEIVAQGVAQAKKDSLTEDFIPFEALLTFQSWGEGRLFLHKDNPSGLPENDDFLEVPIFLDRITTQTSCTEEAKVCPDGSTVVRTGPDCQFTPCPESRDIKIYYYDSNLDKDSSGNISCSSKGLVPLVKKIAVTSTPIQDAIKTLLAGDTDGAGKSKGLNTEYPLKGLSLKGASLKEGNLTLEFEDLYGKTGGGSCRTNILWSQIEATAMQFPEVKHVTYSPDTLFQP